MAYSQITRIFHALLAVFITFQLVSSLVMDHPHRDRPMTSAGGSYFHWHEWVGLATLAILFVGWIYRVVKWKHESQRRLFPWLTRAGRHELRDETTRFLKLHWNRLPQEGALAGTMHGLGILLTTAMAVTGGWAYLELRPDEIVTKNANSLMSVHSFLSTFMWIYICGHVVMALWHEYEGHQTLRRMFRMRGD
jgi:cytochrome b561